jgi:site-specific recombinase XerD
LTDFTNSVSTHVGDRQIDEFLKKLSPALLNREPLDALVPWACDVLHSKRSIEAYGQDLRDFLSHMANLGIAPQDVKADHVRLYKAALRESGKSPGTISRKLSVLRGVYRQLAKRGLVSWETAQDIVAVASPRVEKNTTPALTEMQARKLLHAPDTTTLQGLRDRAILHTFFITACRVSALASAKVGHLEFDGVDHYLRVTEKRGKKQRKILLDAARSVLAYLDAAGIASDVEGPLFRSFAEDGRTLSDRPLHRSSMWRLVKRYCVVAGLDPRRLGGRGVGVHSLRKTAINNAIENGASLHEAREFSGHSDIRTTELYFVRRDEDAERAARRIQIR